MDDSSKESYMKYKLCVVCNVPQSEAPGVIYAKFPKNVNRCRKWIRMIGNVKLLQLSLKKIQNRYVCGNHFVRSYFTKSHKHLRKDAVPTIVMPNSKPLTRDAVKLFPPLSTRTNNKVTLKCTQRIVPIKREVAISPDPPDLLDSHYPYKLEATDYEFLDEEYVEPYQENETRITVKQEALDPSLRDCIPSLIPILHHNLPPNSQTTEIYTINKDRQVVPITTKVLNDGKECDVTVESIGYRSDAIRRVGHTSPKKHAETRKEAQLQKKIQRLQKRNRQLKRMLKNISITDEITSPHIKKVIEKAILNKQLNVGINEFTKERQLAISILKRALSAYHYLSYLIPLPNVCTLQKISTKDPVYSNTTKCRHLL
ncbi:hypothetical protein MSG28_010743 [Choristoneura fumiferana]|uniref:Uncharacterized protein n=1 Tax=Choristoneura fumiferana TaxID=7141 RepID=A0ACC0KPN3_CHOFU|nr:hypothetical protein MSG28_010743 [Choristoneura fumiferana]